MKPYSFTPNGGAEYLIPIYRKAFSDNIKFTTALIDIAGSGSAYNPLGYRLIPKMRDFVLTFSLVAVPGTSKLDDLVAACTNAFSTSGSFKVLMDDGSFGQQTVYITDVKPDRTRKASGICDVTITGLLFPYWISTIQNSTVVNFPSGIVTNTGKYSAIETITLLIKNTTGGVLTAVRINNTFGGVIIADINISTISAGETLTALVGTNSVFSDIIPVTNFRKNVSIVLILKFLYLY